MAEELLVDDQIDGGQMTIDRFLEDGLDVAVAFWIKTDEGFWRLYIASPFFDDRKPGENYLKVRESLRKVPDPEVQFWPIYLINDQNPAARDALKIAGHPGKKEGIRYRGPRLGDLPIEEAYIYPRPRIPVRQAFIVTYKREDRSNRWSATTERKEISRNLRPKGALAYSKAQGLGEQADRFAHVYVLVEVDPLLDERTIATNPVILQTLADQARSMADEMFKSKNPDAIIEHQKLVMSLV
jgi:hypothetical protein